MTELCFKIDYNDSEVCLEAAKKIAKSMMSFKEILDKFTERCDYDKASSDGKKTMLEQLSSFLLLIVQSCVTEIEFLEEELESSTPKHDDIELLRNRNEELYRELEKYKKFETAGDHIQGNSKQQPFENQNPAHEISKSIVSNTSFRSSHKNLIDLAIIYNQECTKIQSVWRGYLCRKKYYKMLHDFINQPEATPKQ